jgi:hypothetical protein
LRGLGRSFQADDEVGALDGSEDAGDASVDLAAHVDDGGPLARIRRAEGSGGKLSERRNGHDHPDFSVARFRAVSEPSQVL